MSTGQPLEKVMQEYKRYCPNSFFTCLELNESTDTMYHIMQLNFQNLHKIPISGPEELQKILSQSILESIKTYGID